MINAFVMMVMIKAPTSVPTMEPLPPNKLVPPKELVEYLGISAQAVFRQLKKLHQNSLVAFCNCVLLVESLSIQHAMLSKNYNVFYNTSKMLNNDL